MKLCWLGCGILAALLALSLLCGMLTQRSTRDAAAALEQALEALDRDETAQAVEAGTQARQHWQRHRRFLCAVLSHDELDGIEQGFAELQAYSAVGDAAERYLPLEGRMPQDGTGRRREPQQGEGGRPHACNRRKRPDRREIPARTERQEKLLPGNRRIRWNTVSF